MMWCSPVGDGRAKRAGLRDQSKTALRHTGIQESCVQPEPGTDKPDAVWTEKAHVRAVRGVEQLAMQPLAFRTSLHEARRQDDSISDALFATIRDDLRDRARRRGNDRQIDVAGHIEDRAVACHSTDFLVLWIDRNEAALEVSGGQIRPDLRPDTVFCIAGAEQGDGFRIEKSMKWTSVEKGLHGVEPLGGDRAVNGEAERPSSDRPARGLA